MRQTTLIFFLLVFSAFAQSPAPTAEQQTAILDQIGERLEGDRLETWTKVRAEHADLLAGAKSEADFYRRLNDLLAKLNLSHFHIAPPSSLAPSTGGEGRLGLMVQLVESKAVVTSVAPDGPAAQVGIKPGWELLSVDDSQLSTFLERLQTYPGTETQQRASFAQAMLETLRFPPGMDVALSLKDTAGHVHTLKPTAAAPTGTPIQLGNLPPLYSEVSHWELPGQIGYVRFNIFMLPLLGQIQEAVLGFAQAKGMILDLRGNLGGLGLMACPVAALFVTEQTSLGRSEMEGGFINFAVFPHTSPYTGPLVILVDECTASTSEILAGGLQELGRATIIGRQTMGAVLPSLVVELPDGAKLQYAVADFHTPKGLQLEGRGIIPDVPVNLTIKSLTESNDPILQTAINYLKSHQKDAPE